MKVTRNKIIYDAEDWIGGLAINFPTSFALPRILGGGYSYGQYIDPLSVIPGVLFPGKGATNLTNVASGSPSSTLIDAVTGLGSTKAWLLSSTKIEEIDITAKTLTVAGGTFPHTIAAHGGHTTLSSAKGSLALYHVSGTSKLFYTWNDNTDWDMGVYDLSTTFDDDFASTVPTNPLGTVATDLTGGTGKYHPLFVSNQDGMLYMGSGRFVHKYDGEANTFYSQVLTLPRNFEIKGFAETQYDLIVFAETGVQSGRRAEARAFFWSQDRPASYYKTVPLDDDSVACPFMYKGTVGCFTNNRDGRASMKLYNGSVFETKTNFTGNLPAIGGCEIQDDMIKWNSDGKIWIWGSYKGEIPVARHLSTIYGSSCGFLKSFDSGNLYSSGGSGTSGLAYFTGYRGGDVTTRAAYPNFDERMQGKVKKVTTVFATATSGGQSTQILLYTKGATTTLTSITDTTSKMIQSFNVDSSGNPLPCFDELWIAVKFQDGSDTTKCPGVVRVEIDYDQVPIPA